MKNRYFIIMLFAIVIASSCNNKAEEKSTNDSVSSTAENAAEEEYDGIKISKTQFESSKMELGTLSEQDFPEIVKTTGMIDVPPQNKEIISSFYGGFIKNSKLLIGDKVRKGQALVTIENPDFLDMQQEYLEIKEQIVFLKSEYERQKTLFDEQIASEKKYQKAQSEYKRKVVALNFLRKKLQLLNINIDKIEQGDLTSVITLYSNISGSVSDININRGTHVDKADKIMEIINTDHIHIELTVFEKDAMKLKKGQKIRFKIPEVSNTYYDAEVHLVGKSIDEKTRTVKVHGHLHHATKNIFDLGMFVDAEIEIKTSKAIALPEDAIVESGNQKLILKLDKEKDGNYFFKQVEVKVGDNYSNYTQIISDEITKSDKVLIKGAFDLVGE